jgi:hypothetical protein
MHFIKRILHDSFAHPPPTNCPRLAEARSCADKPTSIPSYALSCPDDVDIHLGYILYLYEGGVVAIDHDVRRHQAQSWEGSNVRLAAGWLFRKVVPGLQVREAFRKGACCRLEVWFEYLGMVSLHNEVGPEA